VPLTSNAQQPGKMREYCIYPQKRQTLSRYFIQRHNNEVDIRVLNYDSCDSRDI
jgi:hypothetical protein